MNPQFVIMNAIIPILVLALFSSGVSSVMATVSYSDFGNLVYLGSDAFGDISRMIESDCYNSIDDDGDGLVDMDDVEDCP